MCRSVSAFLVLMWFGSPLLAGVIHFDEFPADNVNGGLPTNRYAVLGVTFSSTDDGSTWDGLSAGDPGSWRLEGTNGPTFAGFNGTSHALTMQFTADVQNFSLDVARSNGSIDGSFTLEGYVDGVLVESATVGLGDINEWQTVALSNSVDEVRWFGIGTDYHPYGVDNVRWSELSLSVEPADVNAVPEPGTSVLFGMVVVCGVGLYLHQRHKRLLIAAM